MSNMSAWHKYGAQRRESHLKELSGISFPSKLERDRAAQLVFLQRAGEISDLVIHPVFFLSDARVRYEADAQYLEHSRVIVEDAKGKETPRFKVCKQLWGSYGPHELRIMKRKGSRIVLAETVMPLS